LVVAATALGGVARLYHRNIQKDNPAENKKAEKIVNA
jgi:hypothetical protein